MKIHTIWCYYNKYYKLDNSIHVLPAIQMARYVCHEVGILKLGYASFRYSD